MPSPTQQQHETLKNLLANRKFDEAEALWLDLAEEFASQTEFLLLLVKEFADAAQPKLAAELAGLLAPNLKAAGHHREWLFALKLQAHANPNDKPLRAEINTAYRALYQTDARLPVILQVAQFDTTTVQLPAAIAKADTLLALNTGNYCQHKSWGVGKIKTFDTALNRIVVAFAHNPDHAMQLPYAADSLLPLNADHIAVKKITDLDALKKLAATDPAALIRQVLISYNHSASADKIEAALAGSVIPVADWKKWWDNAKKQLKRDPQILVPAKKTESIILRTVPVSQSDDLLEAFRVAPSLTQKTEAARQLLKIADTLTDPDLLLQEFQDGLLEAIQKLRAAYAVERLEAAFVVADLQARQTTAKESIAPLINEILVGCRDLPALLEELSTSSQKRVIASQADRLIADLNRLPAKTLDALTETLAGHFDKIAVLVRNQTASAELLFWLCRNLEIQPWLHPLQSAQTLRAIISAAEDGTAKARRRMRDLLFSDDELIASLLATADTDTAKEISRQLLNSPAFEELDRRSLMARIIKIFPFVQEFIVTKTTKEAPLIVSKASFEKRRAELDEIITKRIPENSKEIGIARSYGDLRENFEFKAAKDLQKVLMRRRAELEMLLARATTTDFADAKTDTVGIGSSVTVTDLDTGKPATYHILGAWDSDPAHGIISYPAALAQAMFNKKAGETIEAAGDGNTQKLRIEKIEKAPADILALL